MKKFTLFFVSVVIGVLIGFRFQPLISGDNVYQNLKKFDKVLNTAVRNYVEDVDSHDLVEAAIKGMLNELDVHSVYIDAERMKKVNEDFKGSFDGIGVSFQVLNDTIIIVSPIPGGPSEALGIMANDKIIKIDDTSAIGIGRDEVPKKLKGPKGTIVEVDILRAGEPELLHFTITRDKIPLYSVDAKYMIDNSDIAVVEVNRFSSTTHAELLEALHELKSQGMKKLILDLRFNPGGYLDQAFYMADEFLPGGDTIVFTKGRKPNSNEYKIAYSGQEYEDIPIIVLINSSSASASEIVSGAIQDRDRGLVVGTTSFGKGLVQRPFQLSDGSSFRITIAKYYTPSGRCIQRPYKDAEKYRHLVGRLDLEEGSYIEEGFDKIKAQLETINMDKKEDEIIHIDSLPIYHTKSGRVVLGGGGIVPDYIIKQDTLTRMTANIRAKNLFFIWVSDFLSNEGIGLGEKYDNDFDKFNKNFEISDKMIASFKKLAIKKLGTKKLLTDSLDDEGEKAIKEHGLDRKKAIEQENRFKWDDEKFEIDKEYITVMLKALIAQSVWNRNGMKQIYQSMDSQILKAIELFPQAEKIMKM